MDASGFTRPEERPLVRRLMDMAGRATRDYVPVVTDFFTPREQIIARSVAAHAGLNVAFWGGYEGAERARAVIAPAYFTAVPEDFEICMFRIAVDTRATLHHGQVLGSILGTGIDRRKIGDIAITSEYEANIAISADLESFVQQTWHKAGRDAISLSRLAGTEPWPNVAYQPRQISVASLRLDAVVAATCKWSRTQAQSRIEAGQVSLNFVTEERPDMTTEAADIISVRGFGRIRIDEIAGETKRGRIRLEIGVIES